MRGTRTRKNLVGGTVRCQKLGRKGDSETSCPTAGGEEDACEKGAGVGEGGGGESWVTGRCLEAGETAGERGKRRGEGCGEG